MNNSKENILKRIAAAGMPEYAYPDFGYEPSISTTLRRCSPSGSGRPGARPYGWTGQRRSMSRTPLLPRCEECRFGTARSDARHGESRPVEDPRELVDIDLGVVSGAFGVAENGAVWIPQDIRHKALYFGATALMVVIPRDALVGRMGGDEFAVFSTCASVEEANAKRASLSSMGSRILASRAVELGCSVGIVRVVRGETFFDLYRAADCALYASKDNGKGCYSW